MFNINHQTIDAYQHKMRAQIKEMKARVKMLEAGAENAVQTCAFVIRKI